MEQVAVPWFTNWNKRAWEEFTGLYERYKTFPASNGKGKSLSLSDCVSPQIRERVIGYYPGEEYDEELLRKAVQVAFYPTTVQMAHRALSDLALEASTVNSMADYNGKWSHVIRWSTQLPPEKTQIKVYYAAIKKQHPDVEMELGHASDYATVAELQAKAMSVVQRKDQARRELGLDKVPPAHRASGGGQQQQHNFKRQPANGGGGPPKKRVHVECSKCGLNNHTTDECFAKCRICHSDTHGTRKCPRNKGNAPGSGSTSGATAAIKGGDKPRYNNNKGRPTSTTPATAPYNGPQMPPSMAIQQRAKGYCWTCGQPGHRSGDASCTGGPSSAV